MTSSAATLPLIISSRLVIARPTRGHAMSTNHTRDRRGCLTCRRRKKKCAISKVDVQSDAGEARCPTCVRLNLRCDWETERTLRSPRAAARDWRPGTSTSSAVSITPALESTPIASTADESIQSLSHRRNALRYYVQSFAATLSTNEQNNGFLSVLLPMAMESRPLLDALIAWSTSHLALHHENFQLKALQDRSTALRSFAGGLPQLSPDLSVAICLVLTSMESILGNTNDWYRHLAAAASMIRSTTTVHQQNGASAVSTALVTTAEGRWLLRNFAYHDVLASVSLNRDMLIPSSTQWLLMQNGDSENDEVLDTYLGVGCTPVSALGEISSLSRHLDSINSNINLSADKIETLNTQAEQALDMIELELSNWQPPSSVEDEALLALAETYRSAALLCLFRTQRFHGLHSAAEVEPRIQEHTVNIVQCISQLPAGCLPECTLLFPLFIAGGETRVFEHQQLIEERMHAIFENRSFANVEIALDVLKEVWDVQSRTLPIDPARPYDWSCVLERRKWELALS